MKNDKKQLGKVYRRMEILLPKATHSFICVEANGNLEEGRVLSVFRRLKSSYIVDFSRQLGWDYDQIVTTIADEQYDTLIFAGCGYEKVSSWILEVINFNRDNLKNLNVNVVFVLPTFLYNELITNYHNLNSYVSFYFDATCRYSSPFRPMLVFDDFTIDTKDVITKTKKLSLQKKDSLESTLNRLETYTCSRYEITQLLEDIDCKYLAQEHKRLTQTTADYYDVYNVIVGYHLRIIKALLKQKYYHTGLERIQYLMIDAYQQAMSVDEGRGSLFGSDGKVDYSNKGRLYQLFKLAPEYLEQYTFSPTHLFELIHCLGYTLFYLKEYEFALDWLFVCYRIGEASESVVDKTSLIGCANDIVVCGFKVRELSRVESFYEKLLEFSEESIKENSRLAFICNYNYIIIKLLHEENDDTFFKHCDSFLEKYLALYREESTLYSKFLTLYAWVLGYVYGQLDKAIEREQEALKIARKVFIENHYSIAECHYCNAVFYTMQGNVEQASYCMEKAINIFSNHSSENSKILDFCKDTLTQISNPTFSIPGSV